MLGEKHSLVHEFPDLKDTITQLTAADRLFAEDAKNYDALDKEIRQLELKNTPVDDETMHQMKHDRATLKDSLYLRLMATKK